MHLKEERQMTAHNSRRNASGLVGSNTISRWGAGRNVPLACSRPGCDWEYGLASLGEGQTRMDKLAVTFSDVTLLRLQRCPSRSLFDFAAFTATLNCPPPWTLTRVRWNVDGRCPWTRSRYSPGLLLPSPRPDKGGICRYRLRATTTFVCNGLSRFTRHTITENLPEQTSPVLGPFSIPR
jgi:hypothetical protein